MVLYILSGISLHYYYSGLHLATDSKGHSRCSQLQQCTFVTSHLCLETFILYLSLGMAISALLH